MTTSDMNNYVLGENKSLIANRLAAIGYRFRLLDITRYSHSKITTQDLERSLRLFLIIVKAIFAANDYMTLKLEILENKVSMMVLSTIKLFHEELRIQFWFIGS